MGMSDVVEREKKCEAAVGAWVGLTRMILWAWDTWLAMGCSNIMVLFNFIIFSSEAERSIEYNSSLG